MTVQVENVSEIKKRLTVTIDAETVTAERDKVLAVVRKESQVRGFRPGKAPLGMIRKQYGEYIDEEVKQNLMGETLAAAIDEENIKVAAQPELEKIEFNEDGSLTIITLVETMPEVQLGEYEGIEITREKVTVLDAAVEARLEAMQRQHGTMREIEDRDVCETGDVARIDFIGRKNGEAFQGGTAEDYQLELGSQTFIPGFEDGVIGLKVGEATKIEVVFPEADSREDLAGQMVEFEVTLKAINQREIPELDDEFAKDTQMAETIEELRQTIHDQIEKAEEGRTRRGARRALVEKLVEMHPIEVPQAMIERQLEYSIRSQKIEMAMAGMPIQDDPAADEALKAHLAPKAKQEVQSYFIFRAIAEAEELEVTEKDLEARFQEMAEQQGREVAEVAAQHQKDNLAESLKEDILDEKVVDFLLERAKITWEDPTEKPAEDDVVDADIEPESTDEPAGNETEE